VEAKRQVAEDAIEQFFADHGKQDEGERYNALVKLLNGYYNGIPSQMVMELYNDWKASARVCWPYPGSRLDQPEWVLYGFRCLELREEAYALKAKIIKPVTATETRP